MGEKFVRYARLYGDGSLNVSSEGESFDKAKGLLSGSADDDDTQLVQVEVRVLQSFGAPKLLVVDQNYTIRAVLEQALDCINDETPEDCTRDEAKADTVEKIRGLLRSVELPTP